MEWPLLYKSALAALPRSCTLLLSLLPLFILLLILLLLLQQLPHRWQVSLLFLFPPLLLLIILLWSIVPSTLPLSLLSLPLSLSPSLSLTHTHFAKIDLKFRASTTTSSRTDSIPHRIYAVTEVDRVRFFFGELAPAASLFFCFWIICSCCLTKREACETLFQ